MLDLPPPERPREVAPIETPEQEQDDAMPQNMMGLAAKDFGLPRMPRGCGTVAMTNRTLDDDVRSRKPETDVQSLLRQAETQHLLELNELRQENERLSKELMEKTEHCVCQCGGNHQQVLTKRSISDALSHVEAISPSDMHRLPALLTSLPLGKQAPDNSTDITLEVGQDTLQRETSCSARWRDTLAAKLRSDRYETCICILVMINMVVMMVEMQLQGYTTGYAIDHPEAVDVPSSKSLHFDDTFMVMNAIFTAIFIVDVLVRIAILRSEFWKSWLNCLDLLYAVLGALEPLAHDIFPLSPASVRLLRLAKLARAVRMLRVSRIFDSLHLLVECIRASVVVLFWSLCLLAIIQCVAGMLINQLVKPYLDDAAVDKQLRHDVYRYYGTFSKTILTMFEVLFANWAPACRVLVENVSEWFTPVFIFYRCLVGFAVLNVLNAVFVQQTMKVAQQDEELAMAQQQRSTALYMAKIQKLFERLDESGDGLVSWHEFSSVMHEPELQFLLSSLDIEHYDMQTLFRMMDNGSGQISIDDFAAGACRLKGQAKSVDMVCLQVMVKRLTHKVDALVSNAKLQGDSGLSTLPAQVPGLWSRMFS